SPRAAAASVAPLAEVSRRLRASIEIELASPAAAPMLGQLPRGGRAALVVRVRPRAGGVARLLLGEDFLPDAEFSAALRRAEGVTLLN
ncbi:MAG: hypothetical protein ACK40H_09890, partial [Sphingomonadaceae bacterium]